MRLQASHQAGLFAILALTLMCCDSLESPLSADNQYVVESFSQVGKPLGTLRLTTASRLDGVYLPENQAISDADVRVFLLAENGSREKEFLYREINGQPGLYESLDDDPVLALRTYELEINAPGIENTISTTALTPGNFELVRPGHDAVIYQDEDQFVLGVTRSEFPGRQTVFIFSVESLDPSVDALTPFYLDILNPDGDPDELDDVLIVESPPINEANYEVLDDNTINLQLPWLAVAFYGPNRISASAIGRNVYDFVRSHDVQTNGGSGLSPGEIPNTINHIQGGTGVFGFYARVSQETNVLRN